MKLAIIPGHEKRSTGAKAHRMLGFDNEYEFAMKVNEHIHRICQAEGVEVQTFLRDHVGIGGAYASVRAWKPDACIEIHFNAFDGKAKGTEVLFSTTNDRDPQGEEAFVQCLLDQMYDVYGRKGKAKRGDKDLSRGERGWYSTSRTNDCPSVLIEPFFGDNEEEATHASVKIESLANALVMSFKKYMEGDWKKGFIQKTAEKIGGKQGVQKTSSKKNKGNK